MKRARNITAGVLNFIGGIPDIIMKNAPWPKKLNLIPYDEYLSNLNFYSPENWVEKHKSFLKLPNDAPTFSEFNRTGYFDGHELVFKYPSRYEVQNPALKNDFYRYRSNLTAYLHLWRHDQSANRPLVLCLHGFLMGDPERAKIMFKIARLFRMGVDVALYTQPHHWKRSKSIYAQHLLNPENVPLTIETFGQNIHDLHSAVLLLKNIGYERVGIIGASLGGFTSALYATFKAPVDFMFMVVPALDFSYYLSPKRGKFTFEADEKIISKTKEALNLISPVKYDAGFDVQKICVVIHTGDRLAESKAAQEWIRRWSIPHHVEVVGGHWLYFDRNVRGRTWYEWLKKMGYLPSSA